MPTSPFRMFLPRRPALSRVHATLPTIVSGFRKARNTLYCRDTNELWLMCGIGLLTLTAYVLTLSHGVVPGGSAIETGKALGLLPSLPATHPLGLLAARIVTKIPCFETVFRLNLFSAVCGSLAAAWLFRITKRIIFEFIRDAPSLQLVPMGDEDPASAPFKASADHPMTDGDSVEHIVSTLGGIITAIAFAFSAPIWIASTCLHMQPFTLLLLFVCLDLVACYHFTGKASACVAAVFLLGLGLVESVTFVALAPLAIVLMLLASIRYSHISESFVLLMLATGFSGLAANLLLFLLQSEWGHTFSSDHFFGLLSSLAHQHTGAFLRGLPKIGGALIFLQTTGPLLLALVSLRVFYSHQDEVARWKWALANLMIAGVSLACLMNLPKTAWALAREGSHLPVIPALSIAIATGAVFVFWCLFAVVPKREDPDDQHATSLGLRLLGFGMCGLLGIVTLRAINTNADDADGRRALFADRIAYAMLDQAGAARCLLTDGTLDLNLLIGSHLSGRNQTFLPCPRTAEGEKSITSDKQAPFRLTLPGADDVPKPSAAAFVEQWLQKNPKARGQVAVIGDPGVWQRAGLLPVPNGLLYSGATEIGRSEAKALLARSQESWLRIAPYLIEDPALRPELRLVHSRIRSHVSRMANDLGVLLEHLEDRPAADTAYGEALRLDERNLCAMLNRYGLSLRDRTLGAPLEFVKLMTTVTAQAGFFDTFDSEVRRGGMLSRQEADRVLPAVMLDYGLGTKPPETMLNLLDKWLMLSRQMPRTQPPSTLAAAEPVDKAPDLKLTQAMAALLGGKPVRAERLLRLLVRNQPGNLSAWSLLAEILMNRGETKEIQDAIIPAMRTASGLGDNTLADMTQGCLLMRVTPPRPAEARACFDRALSLNPKLPVAGDRLLSVDRLLGDAAQIEADALKIVSGLPDHTGANAILGSRRLAQKRYAESEGFLRQSIKSQPTAGALNDLAELLRQQNKPAEAEQQARLAIRSAPNFYQAWDTLGNILLETGRTDEAYSPLHCAFALGANDPRLYLTLTRLRIKEGNLKEATRILDSAKTLLSKTAPSVRDDHAHLMRSLQSLAGNP